MSVSVSSLDAGVGVSAAIQMDGSTTLVKRKHLVYFFIKSIAYGLKRAQYGHKSLRAINTSRLIINTFFLLFFRPYNLQIICDENKKNRDDAGPTLCRKYMCNHLYNIEEELENAFLGLYTNGKRFTLFSPTYRVLTVGFSVSIIFEIVLYVIVNYNYFLFIVLAVRQTILQSLNKKICNYGSAKNGCTKN